MWKNLLDISFSIDRSDAKILSELIIVILIFVGVISLIAYPMIKNKDKNKPLQMRDCKIIKAEETIGAGSITIEFDNGERMILVKYDKNILLTTGDKGVVEYRGDTLVNFRRNITTQSVIHQENISKEPVHHKQKSIPLGKEWQCPNCGKTHQHYVGTCGCGERKPL